MKLLTLMALLLSINLFADEAEDIQKEKEVEAMLAELEEADYNDTEVIKSLNQSGKRMPASVEE